MLFSQCQVCGRRKGLRADGAVRAHYRGGDLCAGAGAPPQGAGLDALRAAIETARAADQWFSTAFDTHAKRRANVPLSARFYHEWHVAFRELLRLKRRLARLERITA